MAEKTTIIVEISPDGKKVSTHVKGVKGKSCLDVSSFIEEGLKTEDKETSLTREYREEKPKVALTTLGRK